jgi:dTDP-4-amino-4,6-dideoxygalactose transaminase
MRDIKYNLTDIAAAIGIHQLRKCNEFWYRRKHIAQLYTEGLTELEEIITPYSLQSAGYSLDGHAWHLYVILIKPEKLSINRNQFIEELKKRNIGTSVHFIPLHLHPYYQKTFGYQRGDFPNAEWVYERCISLPIYPKMTDTDVEYVVESIRDIVTLHRK